MKLYPTAQKYIDRMAKGIPHDRWAPSACDMRELGLEIAAMAVELARYQSKEEAEKDRTE